MSFPQAPHPHPLPTRGRGAAHATLIAIHLPPPRWGRVGVGGHALATYALHTRGKP